MSYIQIKNAFAVACLLLIVFSAFGQEKKSFSLGILAEANANTRQGYGLAGGINSEFSFTDHLAAGIKADYGTDFYDVSSAEAIAYGRWYFRNTPIGFPLFIQLGGGAIVLFEDDRYVISGLGDGAVGIRFPVKKFYTEQYVRFGWPTGFGFGIVVGYRFGVKPAAPLFISPDEPQPLPFIPIESQPEKKVEIPQNLEVHFASNTTDFYVLGEGGIDTLMNNMIVLNTIASFMKANSEFNLIIIGHANPVEGTEEEEWSRLIPLSQRRAEFVKSEIEKIGVPNDRMFTYGLGGREAGTTSSPTNRRVSFRFEK
jgi:outer membrane protein OmpA-like peptidoglycan-associated protein